MMNFSDLLMKNCLSCQLYKQLGRYEVRCLASQKLNRLAISVCQRIVLLESGKVKVSLQARERDRFGVSWGCNGET